MPNNITQEYLLYLLHKKPDKNLDEWHEEIYSEFKREINVLTREERLILDLRIEYYELGFTTKESVSKISALLRVPETRVKQYCGDIKYKLRNDIGYDPEGELNKFIKGIKKPGRRQWK